MHVAAALCVVYIGACGPNAVDAMARQLHAASVPPGATVSMLLVTHDDTTLSATWEVRGAPADYLMWLRHSVGPQFDAIAEVDNVLRFRRSLPGDVYVLEVVPRTGVVGSFELRFRAVPS